MKSTLFKVFFTVTVDLDKLKQDLLELDPELGETLTRQRSVSHHSDTGSQHSRTRAGSEIKLKEPTDPKSVLGAKLIDTEKAETGSVSSL